jgi:hypothetical protein
VLTASRQIGDHTLRKRTAGKIFSTPEEAGVALPTKEELARARKVFDEFQQKVDAVAPEDRAKEVSPKFWDDTSGTDEQPKK